MKGLTARGEGKPLAWKQQFKHSLTCNTSYRLPQPRPPTCPHTSHLVHMQQCTAHSWPGVCSHLTFTLLISVDLSILVLGNTLCRFSGDSTILRTGNIHLLTIWGGVAPASQVLDTSRGRDCALFTSAAGAWHHG